MNAAARNLEGAPNEEPLRVSEQFGVEAHTGLVWRRVNAGSRSGPQLQLQASPKGNSQDELRAAWDQAWLRGAVPAPKVAQVPPRSTAELRVVDLFAGCGAMSLGLRLAAESLGMRFRPLLAADFEPAALRVYEANHAPATVVSEDISKSIRYQTSKGGFLTNPSLVDSRFKNLVDGVEVLVGGPPCQGHSDLNNHSRRNDPKNSLYFLMAAMAIELRPKIVIIENVPSVVHDRNQVVQESRRALEEAGFAVDEVVVSMGNLGVAQRRRRHVLVGVRAKRTLDLASGLRVLATSERPVSWAIGDLLDTKSSMVFDSPSTPNEENRRRIDWLFENDEHDLPNALRPKCHQDDDHSYRSMYGRMRWEEPAQTVTSGFGSPGQGRYVHPRRKRMLTPHEAARLQFIPDSFRIDPEGSLLRSKMAVMIGNAVPPKLSYVIGLSALSLL